MNLPYQNASVVFNKLVVNTVEDTSGIFIGTNQAIAWSTYRKSNQGFGSLKESVLINAVNVVNDQDLIDASVKDVKNITLAEEGQTLKQCAVDFESINAISVLNGSAIDIGENSQIAWSSSHKNNYGTGKSYGNNRLKQVANQVIDNDVIDAHVGNIIQNSEYTGGENEEIRVTQKK